MWLNITCGTTYGIHVCNVEKFQHEFPSVGLTPIISSITSEFSTFKNAHVHVGHLYNIIIS